MDKNHLDQGQAVLQDKKDEMQSTMNFTGEAAKVLAVLAGFEAEIKRLTEENKSLANENEQLKLRVTIEPEHDTRSFSREWEVPPQEVEEHVSPAAERAEDIEEQQQSKQHKRRGPNKPAEQESRCNALVPVLELNSHGEMVPSQCKRSSESCGFCKQHADHQSYGTTDRPNVDLFEKNRVALEKAFNKKNGLVESKKAKKPKSEVKRALNPYMMFLQVNRDKVKEELLAENPLLKGKELAMSITRHVGRLWQSAKGNTSAEEDDVSDDSTEYSETEVEAELDRLLGF